jgi:hypothetical protein
MNQNLMLEKENFELKHELRRLKRNKGVPVAGGNGTTKTADKAKTREFKSPANAKAAATFQKQEEKEPAPVAPVSGEAGDDESAADEALRLHAEKDDLLRRMSDMETEMLELKEAAGKCTCSRNSSSSSSSSSSGIQARTGGNNGGAQQGPLVATMRIEEARKRERKAFQSLAAHDAAFITKLKRKLESQSKQRESMRALIDEISTKAVTYADAVQEKTALVERLRGAHEALESELVVLRMRRREEEEDSSSDRCTGTGREREEGESVHVALGSGGGGVTEENGQGREDLGGNADDEEEDEDDDGSAKTVLSAVDSIPEPVPQWGMSSTPSVPAVSVAAAVTTGEGCEDEEVEERGEGGHPELLDISRISLNGTSTAAIATPNYHHNRHNRRDDGISTTTDYNYNKNNTALEAAAAAAIEKATLGYNEEISALHESIRHIVARGESETVGLLRSQLAERDQAQQEQSRRFESMIADAQEVALLEAQEIARLERGIQEAQIELRMTQRAARGKDAELARLRDDKRLLEDMLIDNEVDGGGAVSKAMAALGGSTSGDGASAAKTVGSAPSLAASGGYPSDACAHTHAMTPGALSAQGMLELMQHQQHQGANYNPQYSQSGGNENYQHHQHQGSEAILMESGNNNNNHTSNDDNEGGLSIDKLAALTREKEREIGQYRVREQELLDALEGVLDRYAVRILLYYVLPFFSSF